MLTAPFAFTDLLNLNSAKAFNALALKAFQFQYRHNQTYSSYCSAIGLDINKVTHFEDIPYLPVRFFKTHAVTTGSFEPEVTFLSSSTTEKSRAKHHVRSKKLYEDAFLNTFLAFYGDPADFTILALLPSYLDRKNASLVYMANRLIEKSESGQSGFYLDDLGALNTTIQLLERRQKPYILLGVTFALLDFAEQFPQRLNHAIIMETGGMKGRRKEMVRQEVHGILKSSFQLETIHSEYGMTELLSQAYSKGNGSFNCPPWMKALTRDPNDPFTLIDNKTGGLNIIDLANIYSCCFIATQDLGRIQEKGTFEVLGRFDHSDVRGCNLMVV